LYITYISMMKYSFKINTLSNGMKLFSRICIFVVAVLVVFPFATHAATVLGSIPDNIKSKYTFNGPIYAAVNDGETLYVGGDFTSVSLSSLGDPAEYERAYIAAIDLSTYTLASFNPVFDDAVRSLALASDGTLYVGGDFSMVNDEEYLYLVALNTDTGEPLSAFIGGPDSGVVALALSPDESALYVGGGFSSPVSNIEAYTTADRTAFDDFETGIDLPVRALAVSSDGASLYVGGDFTNITGAIPRFGIARVDAETGWFDGDFTPAISGGSVYDMELSSDDSTLYVGGDFDTFFRQSGEGALFNDVTKTSVTSPVVSTQGGGGGGTTIYAVIPDGDGGWYIGGSFTHVGSMQQARLAHITAAGALDVDFSPSIENGQVNALELSLDGTVLYAGGSFNQVDGESRNNVAGFLTATGAVTSFDPSPYDTVNDLELSSDGETLYVAGDFSLVAEGTRSGIAAFDVGTDGSLLPFDADVFGSVYTVELSPDDATLYIGGSFSSIKYGSGPGTLRNNIAALTTAGAGAATAFNPSVDGVVHDLLLSGDEATLYAGGEFLTVGGENRSRFAGINTTTGSSTALDAGITGEIGVVRSIGVSSDGATIYLGGSDFLEVGGSSRGYFAEIDALTGAVTTFDPDFDDAVRAIAVDTDAERLYVGGSFSGFGFTNVSRIAAINIADNALVSEFDDTEANGSVFVLQLSSDDSVLYAGGLFTEVNSGTVRDYLAAFDVTDGAVTTFDPDGTFSVYGMSLAPDDSELYVGSYDADETSNSDMLVFDVDGGVPADVTAPVITLVGDATLELTVGDTYTDAGATAEDDTDGDITADIVVVNPVDTGVVGTYTVTYNVEDAAGNPATEVTRTVTVSEAISTGSSGRRGAQTYSAYGRDLKFLLEKLVGLLQQYLALLLTEKQQ
jgi:WD40 repeat protein